MSNSQKISQLITPVTRGGSGVTTITGVIKGNGTSPVTPAVPGVDFQTPLVAGTDFQTPLVAGTNIKTLGGVSVLGSGNIVLPAPDLFNYTNGII